MAGKKRTSGDGSARAGLVAAVLLLFLAIFAAGGCSDSDTPPGTVPRKAVVRIRIPQQPKPATPAEPRAAAEKEKKTRETAAPVTVEKRPPAPAAAPVEKRKDGRYTVRKGESLSTVAGRPEVYGDPMKWPGLYRLNMDRLAGMKIVPDMERQSLPPGTELRFLTKKEARVNLARLGSRPWVVNVLSSPVSEKIVPAAVRLMKSGYRVYITRAVVKGKKWFRLRAGFFNDRKSAEAAAGKIMTLLDARDAWVARIGKTERDAFGGY